MLACMRAGAVQAGRDLHTALQPCDHRCQADGTVSGGRSQARTGAPLSPHTLFWLGSHLGSMRKIVTCDWRHVGCGPQEKIERQLSRLLREVISSSSLLLMAGWQLHSVEATVASIGMTGRQSQLQNCSASFKNYLLSGVFPLDGQACRPALCSPQSCCCLHHGRIFAALPPHLRPLSAAGKGSPARTAGPPPPARRPSACK